VRARHPYFGDDPTPRFGDDPTKNHSGQLNRREQIQLQEDKMPTTRNLLVELKEAYKANDDEGCWCRVFNPKTKSMDIMKLVDIHQDGYFLFVAHGQYYKKMGLGGTMCSVMIREDEIELEWTRCGTNLVGSHISDLDEDWFLM